MTILRNQLYVSDDLGLTYGLEKEGTLDELLARGKELDAKFLRWVIKDNGTRIKHCFIHMEQMRGMHHAKNSMMITEDTEMMAYARAVAPDIKVISLDGFMAEHGKNL